MATVASSMGMKSLTRTIPPGVEKIVRRTLVRSS